MARSTSTSQIKAELDFYRNLLAARYFEGMVSAIMELSGYEVYPYGYETLLPALRRQFRKNRSKRAPTEERLRSTPDLLVVDPAPSGGTTSTRLVEVKFRCWRKPQYVRLGGIPWYKKYWPDVILVVIIPAGDYFYAQVVDKLNGRNRYFDLSRQFRPVDAVFRNVKQETLRAFADDVQSFAAAR